jgi:hypothetical protein
MKDFGGETPYSVMFGPDICGFGTRKTHVIFNYKEKNHLVKKDIKCETDQLSHVYTLRLMPNNTYEVGLGGMPAQHSSLVVAAGGGGCVVGVGMCLRCSCHTCTPCASASSQGGSGGGVT